MKKDKKSVLQMPLVALRGLNVFPNMILHFDVARQKSIKALEEAMVSDQSIFLVAQKEADIEEPEEENLYQVGTISSIKQILKLPTNTIRVLVEGNKRGKIISFEQEEPYFLVNVEEHVSGKENSDVNKQALLRVGAEVFE